jgi:hypothetical protein
MTWPMRFMSPRPLEDDAWRTGDTAPGVAHFYGWDGDVDGRSKCWANVATEGTRAATEDDVLCPDCEGWYWDRIDALPRAGETPLATLTWNRSLGDRRGDAEITDRAAGSSTG